MMNNLAMNTQALDALASICGTAVSVPATASASSVATNNAAYYALIQRKLQETQAAAAGTSQIQQSARQAAALATVSPDVLQACYLVSSGLAYHKVPSNASRTVALDHGAGARFASGLGGGHNIAALAGLRPANHPNPNAEAQAIAIKIFMDQQQMQQQQPRQQYTLPSVPTNKSPPALLMTNQAVHTPAATQYPQALPSPSPYNSPIMPQHNNIEISPTQDSTLPTQDRTLPTQDKKSKPRSKPSAKRPPPKKRQFRASGQEVGGGSEDPADKSVTSEWEGKKLAKRAANRLSAHLSRKRKKMFVEELEGENEELRRKEQILRYIPDLVVVFDSSGIMPFVSQSVKHFLDYTTEKLADMLFWDLLSEDSVQLIKSAFMDALAAKRPPEEDSTPLCNGEPMTVELFDKDHCVILVSLKGVVHFTEELPECVCSIRPEDVIQGRADYSSRKNKKAFSLNTTSSSSSEASSGSTAGSHQQRSFAADSKSHRISDVDSEKSNSPEFV